MKSVWILLALGIVIRGLCVAFDIQKWASGRVEVVNSVTEFQGVEEALFLSAQGHGIYDGSNVHHAPLVISMFQVLHWISPSGVWFEWITQGLFVLVDVLTAFTVREMSTDKQSVVGDVSFAIAFLHPFAIMTSLARSSSSLSTLLLMTSMQYTQRGKMLGSMLFLSLACHMSVHYLLLFPAIVLWGNEARKGEAKITVGGWLIRLGQFVGFSVLFIGLGYLSTGSFGFIEQCMMYQIGMDDMRPNLGLWWVWKERTGIARDGERRECVD